jgi:hypothetical protein
MASPASKSTQTHRPGAAVAGRLGLPLQCPGQPALPSGAVAGSGLQPATVRALAPFEARLRQELAELGLRQRIVLASNPVAARMLANGHDGLAVGDADATRAALLACPSRASACRQRRPKRLPAWACASWARYWPCRATPGQALCGPGAAAPRPAARPAQPGAGLLPATRPFRNPAGTELRRRIAPGAAVPLRRMLNDLAAFLAGRDCGVQRFACIWSTPRGRIPCSRSACWRPNAMPRCCSSWPVGAWSRCAYPHRCATCGWWPKTCHPSCRSTRRCSTRGRNRRNPGRNCASGCAPAWG